MSQGICATCGHSLLDQDEQDGPVFCDWKCCLAYMMEQDRAADDEELVENPDLTSFCHP